MAKPSWIVVVVRAWSEDGQLRVRLLRAGQTGGTDVAVAGSERAAARQLEEWLEELRQAGHGDGIARHATDGSDG